MDRKNFQYIIFGIFAGLLVLGFISLALFGFLKKNDQASQEIEAELVIWGTISEQRIKPILNNIIPKSLLPVRATYIEKNKDELRDEYINSLALREGPDIILADHNTLFELEKTILKVPYTSFSLSSYQDYFAPSASILIQPRGYLGVPFLIDSLVLYYNENLRLKSRLQFVPSVWEHFTHQEILNSIKTESAKVTTAVIPLGSYNNYENSVDLFLTLLLQTSQETGLTKDGVKNVFDYYKSFSDVRSTAYTWSAALPDAKSFYIQGNLLFLPGYISEYDIIRRSNQNIVTRVSEIPQLSDTDIPATISDIYAFSIVKSSKNCAVDPANCAYYQNISINFIFDLLGIFQDPSNNLSKILPLPPAIQGYYADNTKSLIEKTFIDTLQTSKTIRISQNEKRELYNIIQNVVLDIEKTEKAAQKTISLLSGKI